MTGSPRRPVDPRGWIWRNPDRSVGSDPDYRFSLANERTFLAWIRTALALNVGGLAIASLLPDRQAPWAAEAIGLLLVALGTTLAVASLRRWTTAEEAMREGVPLPPSGIPRLLAIGVVVVTTVALVLLIVSDGA